MPTAEAKNFSAWINKMPGSSYALHLKGTATAPTTGWAAKVTKTIPQGINPKYLLLDVEYVEPDGIVHETITEIPVEFTEDPAEQEYSHVTLLGFTIEVKIVR